VINAGEYNRPISIYKTTVVKDKQGFQKRERVLVLKAYAKVKTTRGYTLIKNNTDFEITTSSKKTENTNSISLELNEYTMVNAEYNNFKMFDSITSLLAVLAIIAIVLLMIYVAIKK
jgi:hypothetical protein